MLDLDNLDPDKVYTVYYVSKVPTDPFKYFAHRINSEYFLRHDGSNYRPWKVRLRDWGMYIANAHDKNVMSSLSIYPLVPEDLTTSLELNALADLDGNPSTKLLSSSLYSVDKTTKSMLT